MPTLPIKATPLPPANAPRELYIQRAFEMIGNTAPFDATGHPAMSLPCGRAEGLPVGLMLIGKHYDEMTIYRAAHAFEQGSGLAKSGRAAKTHPRRFLRAPTGGWREPWCGSARGPRGRRRGGRARAGGSSRSRTAGRRVAGVDAARAVGGRQLMAQREVLESQGVRAGPGSRGGGR